jgi:ATP-binding protein involved in chromosome partitioning
MTQLSSFQIESALADYQDPYLKQDLMTAKVVKHIHIADDLVQIELVFGYPLAGFKETLRAALHDKLQMVTGTRKLVIEISWNIDSHVGQRGLKSMPNIKNIIAVASGKGGVGKSTTAVNLALALAHEGARAAILDADIYGPSVPMMLGATEPPDAGEKKTLLPVLRHGIQSMSIGYLIDTKAAMIWRGPMVTTALMQLLNDTEWDNLDYLIIDLPPGTGDIQLTLAQKIPVSAAVVVTTPQDLALLDARRAYEMFLKVNVPVLGVIENMSTHICSQCGHAENIFGAGGGERLAGEYGIDLLGALPLDKNIREQTDGGTPTVASNPESKHAKIYREIARQIAAKLSLQAKDYSHKFPSIVVKND